MKDDGSYLRFRGPPGKQALNYACLTECYGRKPGRARQYCHECEAEFCYYYPGFPVALRRQWKKPDSLYQEYPITGFRRVMEKNTDERLAETE